MRLKIERTLQSDEYTDAFHPRELHITGITGVTEEQFEMLISAFKAGIEEAQFQNSDSNHYLLQSTPSKAPSAYTHAEKPCSQPSYEYPQGCEQNDMRQIAHRRIIRHKCHKQFDTSYPRDREAESKLDHDTRSGY